MSPLPRPRHENARADRLLRLGLASKDLVLPALTFAVGAITLGTGRTHVLQGAVHLLIFAAFLFLAIVP